MKNLYQEFVNQEWLVEMKILVVSQYYFPEQFRITDICEELVRKNNEVTVVTGLPNYPEGEIYPGYEKTFNKKTIINGVNVIRCNLRPRHKGVKNLILNYLSFVIEAQKVLSHVVPDFDLIYIYEVSPITTALPAIWYKNKFKIPIYLYCLDIWPECVRDVQNGHALMSLHNPVYVVAKILSKYVYKNVDIIGVKCEFFSDYLNNVCNINRDKMLLLYEHAENTYLSISESPNDNGIIDFMFLGNIGESQNCDLLIEAFSRTNYKNKAKLHFVGDGSYASKLKTIVKEKKLSEDIIFHGKHSLSEINSFYEYADVCLLSLSSSTASGLTPPGKLYSYLASSRPIVGMINGSAKDVIEKANCGFVVKDRDVDALTCVMQKIINNPTCLNGLGLNGRKYFVNNFTLEKHILKLEEQLMMMIGKK